MHYSFAIMLYFVFGSGNPANALAALLAGKVENISTWAAVWFKRRVMSLKAYDYIRLSTLDKLHQWALVEDLNEGSIQRAEFPLRTDEITGSGRWEANDRGGWYALIREAIIEWFDLDVEARQKWERLAKMLVEQPPVWMVGGPLVAMPHGNKTYTHPMVAQDGTLDQSRFWVWLGTEAEKIRAAAGRSRSINSLMKAVTQAHDEGGDWTMVYPDSWYDCDHADYVEEWSDFLDQELSRIYGLVLVCGCQHPDHDETCPHEQEWVVVAETTWAEDHQDACPAWEGRVAKAA
jgi:hypothetical protein